VKVDSNATRRGIELEKWLIDRGVDVVRKESSLPGFDLSREAKSPAPADLFCIFVLGGDGTFLSAVRWIGDQEIPIVGVKFGEVGFLAEIGEDALFSVAETILQKGFTTKSRMQLQVRVKRAGREIACESVLNDVVINKGALARLAHIETYIDDQFLTTYKADGLIVATPTGSTAYSLAAGGPVIHPGVPGILMTPICPFTLTNRPLLVPQTARIMIRLEKKSSDIMLTFDGQAGLPIDHQDTIVVTRGPHPLQMVDLPDHHYFDVLKEKLRWSGCRV
jgi:NAD+ kinase